MALNSKENIEKGYSGAAIVSPNGSVIAVAMSRYNQEHADAISIKYLADVWDEMPSSLLLDKVIDRPKQLFQSKYIVYLSLVLLLFMVFNFIFSDTEEEKLIRYGAKIDKLSKLWEGSDKYNSKDYNSSVKKEALNLSREIEVNINDNNLLSLQSKIQKLEMISYTYGITSDMSSSSSERIKYAQKSIQTGERALILMKREKDNLWLSNNDFEEKITLILVMGYLIQVEEGNETLLSKAKNKFQAIDEWYHSDISNQIDIVDKFDNH